MRRLGAARHSKGKGWRCAQRPAQCAYIGDDWPDLPVLAQAGLAATVADACAECKAIAHWISTAPAGRGAVRELAEFIVRAQGKYHDLLARHSSGGLHA